MENFVSSYKKSHLAVACVPQASNSSLDTHEPPCIIPLPLLDTRNRASALHCPPLLPSLGGYKPLSGQADEGKQPSSLQGS